MCVIRFCSIFRKPSLSISPSRSAVRCAADSARAFAARQRELNIADNIFAIYSFSVLVCCVPFREHRPRQNICESGDGLPCELKRECFAFVVRTHAEFANRGTAAAVVAASTQASARTSLSRSAKVMFPYRSDSAAAAVSLARSSRLAQSTQSWWRIRLRLPQPKSVADYHFE